MKLIFLLIATLATNTVFAKDFRALNYGDKCDNLAHVEADLGTIQVSGNVFKGIFVYQGIQIGEEATIYYSCTDSNFESGMVLYKLHSERELEKFIDEVKQLMSDFHTAPANNSLEQSKMKMTVWKLENSNYISLGIAHDNSVAITFSKYEE